ncbi:polysaccharide deacetylase family protein [Tamlana sp. I1]|uniref:polysaccharide deacetylase family protein n=1 Tax=Tamlana sp. I1 TaxID=2762061 RepID=UPI00188EAD1E|nr:polysaccharide deacetylase family protein [Tamlana sp. I1]
MINSKLIIYSCLILTLSVAFGQSKKDFSWPNGAKAAVCLTYDDGLPSHIKTVVPALKKYNFKGTFYPTLASSSIYEDMDKWKALANNGHELGNHTVYHPCQKSAAGMDWVKPYHDLDNYTLDQISEEIKLANTMLMAIDGEKDRTFAYPCAHHIASGKSYRPFVASQFLSARDSSEAREALLELLDIDLNKVPSWAPNGHNAEALIGYIQNIIENETFSTFTFHGIGAEYLSVSKEDHEKMLKFLDANRDKIWVATFKQTTDYLASYKNSFPKKRE